ncbi:MAG: thioredoxin [Candidatus Pelagibacter sp.]|nr:thioredoxin [Candidatus Pelagibacter sp.]
MEGLDFILSPQILFVFVFLLFIYYIPMFRSTFFLTSIFLILNTNNTYSQPNILNSFKNIIIHEIPKDLPILEFKNKKGNRIIFNDFSSKLTLINFWATWCAPCRKELPKLNNLTKQISKNQMRIVLVNIENIKYGKIKNFFDEIKIKNLDSFFDINLKITKELKLRGIPVTLIVDSYGKEKGRIIGDLDFTDSRFVNWINAQ